jgi:hypothetical protein
MILRRLVEGDEVYYTYVDALENHLEVASRNMENNPHCVWSIVA